MHSSQGEAGSAIVNIVTCNINMDHLIYKYQTGFPKIHC